MIFHNAYYNRKWPFKTLSIDGKSTDIGVETKAITRGLCTQFCDIQLFCCTLRRAHRSIVRPLVTTKPGWGLGTSVVTSQGQKDTMGAWEKSFYPASDIWSVLSSQTAILGALQLVTQGGILLPSSNCIFEAAIFTLTSKPQKIHHSEHILQKWEHYSGIETFYTYLHRIIDLVSCTIVYWFSKHYPGL